MYSELVAEFGYVGAAQKQDSAAWCAELALAVQTERAKRSVGRYVCSLDLDPEFARGLVLSSNHRIPTRIIVLWDSRKHRYPNGEFADISEMRIIDDPGPA